MAHPQSQSAMTKPARFALVDLVRGVAILAMVAYHLGWDLWYLGFMPTDVTVEPGWVLLQRSILASFLLLVGAGLVLGHGRGIRWSAFWRRFAVLAAASALVTVGTYLAFPAYFVFFGVLHAIALFSLCALPLLRSPLWLVIGTATLFLVAPAILVLPEFTDKWLAWIGFWPVPPETTDIVPFFPWFGVVLLGMAGMRLLLVSPWRPALERWRASRWTGWLAAAGRWSLIIYLLHQPLLLGGLTLLAQLQPAEVLPPEVGTNEAFLQSCESSCGDNGSGAGFCRRYCGCALDVLERDAPWALSNTGATTREGREALRGVERLCTEMAE